MSEDIVRVLKIVEYVGPRSWIEKTLEHSIQGTINISPSGTIKTAIIGSYPEILNRPKKGEQNVNS